MSDYGLLARVATDDGRVLELHRDPDAPNPFEAFDNFGQLVWWHRRYVLGPPHPFATPEAFQAALDADPDAVALPVYLYDHSGLAVSTERTGCFADRWDAGQIGWIWAPGDRVRAEYGAVTSETRARAANLLRSEIAELDAWLRGHVYGFVAYRITRCPCCGQITGRTDTSSCWGFYDAAPYPEALPDWARDLLPVACRQAGLPVPA